MSTKEILEEAGFRLPDPLICHTCFFAAADPAIHNNNQERRIVECHVYGGKSSPDFSRGCRRITTSKRGLTDTKLSLPALREIQAPQETTTSLLSPIPFDCPALRAKKD